jgi:polyphosphate kinase
MDSPDLKAPQQYINRELSFLEFNQRVLDQAFDESVPARRWRPTACRSRSS